MDQRARYPRRFQEYPKWVEGPDGPVLVENAEQERKATQRATSAAQPPAGCSIDSDAGEARHSPQPCMPIVTAHDEEERRARALARQRERRRDLRRIDYYPSGEAAEILDQLRADVGISISYILDQIIVEWVDIPEVRGSPELHRTNASED